MAAHSEERERQAERELGHTDVSRRLALVLIALFLALIGSAGAIQLALRPPDPAPLLSGIPSECELERFEEQLEDDSPVGAWLLPRLQLVLTGLFGVGNEQVYAARGGWLYHRLGVDYVTGPGFLEPRVLEARRLGGGACDPPPQPDPLPAIAGFQQDLAARGIRLLLLPTPVKAVVAPERLARRRSGPLQNPSYARFLALLEERGVAHLDPTPLLLAPGSYLATDTHWRPAAMERVAEALAARIEGLGAFAAPGARRYERENAAVRHFGDLALLLNLPESQRLFAPEDVTIRPVREDGRPWRASPGAEVLLLGDSFSNVYSDRAAFASERAGDAFHWGEGAGLAEQLSYFLQRPVDRIVRNAGGAHSARADLVREVAQRAAAGEDRLAGVRVVVWQFAMRELAQGDWKEIALAPQPAPGTAAPAAPKPAHAAGRVRGTLVARAEAPRPGSVPYRDALIALQLRDLEDERGESLAGDRLVYVFGMRDDRWTDAARLAPGARVALRVEPFESEGVQQRVGSLNRVELDDLELLALPAFFGELLAEGGDAP